MCRLDFVMHVHLTQCLTNYICLSSGAAIQHVIPRQREELGIILDGYAISDNEVYSLVHMYHVSTRAH
jgi:hypothetical protein